MRDMTKMGLTPSRRQFIGAASAATLATMMPRGLAAQTKSEVTFKAPLLPSMENIWADIEKLGSFGPRYTGSDSHRNYVEFLASGLESAGLHVERDTYKFPRWQPKKWSLSATPKGGKPTDIPVTFYYPQSGQTGPGGVTAPLAYAGTFNTSSGRDITITADVKGKIAYIDFDVIERHYSEWYKPWGVYTSDTTFPSVVTSIIAVAAPSLDAFKKAGAVGVVFGWTNLSDAQAKNQNLPFGHAVLDMPTLWVGPEAGKKLKEMATSGGTATLTLDADVFQNTSTDTVYATLPGTSPEEVIILNTHTDGPNAIQENGGVGILNLARYLAKVPKSDRNRSFVIVLATGHYASAYVPSIHGFIEQHPDIIKKTVASFAVEHLGCREWLDNEAMQYVATGKDDVSYGVTKHETMGKILLASAVGTTERRLAVGSPTPKGRYLGEAGAIGALNIPTIGYFAGPSYLNMEAPDACISKLSKTHMYGQITMVAKALHKIDATSAAELSKGGPA